MKINILLSFLIIAFFSNSCALMSSLGLNNKASWETPKPLVSPELVAWKKAQTENTEESYLSYLNKFPYGKFKYDARLQLQLMATEVEWEKAKLANTEEAYKMFMRDHAGSKYNAQAFANLTAIRQNDNWIKTKSINTLVAYGDFIQKYPLSTHIEEAKSNYLNIQSEEEWNRIKDFKTAAPFEEFTKKFPSSKFINQAKAKIQELNQPNYSKTVSLKAESPNNLRTKISESSLSTVQSSPTSNSTFSSNRKNIEKENSVKIDLGAEKWSKAEDMNTPEAYQTFLREFPKHKYAALAKKQLAILDEQAWMRTNATGTKESYESYLQSFPTGRYIKEAKKKSIDQEVQNILAGEYSALPAMNKKEEILGSKLNEITIKNITGFNLVIIYSGIVSEKIEVKDGSSMVVKLPNGPYNITATLNSDLIGSFVGKEILTGGKYETKFFLGY